MSSYEPILRRRKNRRTQTGLLPAEFYEPLRPSYFFEPTPSLRVYELAGYFGLTPKDMVRRIRHLGIDCRNHMSRLPVRDILQIDRAIARELPPEPVAPDGGTSAPGLVALVVFGDRIKPIELRADGSYCFLDESQHLQNVIYVLSRERLGLGQAIDELEELVNSTKAPESAFQDFFERHPDFILNDDYKRAHPHVVLSRAEEGPLIPDFVLEPVDGTLSDLLELKLPTAEVFTLKKNRNRFSAAVHDACAQLREYARYFEDPAHRRTVQERFGLLLYRPRLVVIIGRRGDVDPIELRAIETDTPQLAVRTYDDVIERMKRRLAELRPRAVASRNVIAK